MADKVRVKINPKASWKIIEKSIECTPDFHDLKKSHRDEFPVFVTGNARGGRHRNRELNGCNYYGVGVTWSENYIMKRSLTIGNRLPEDPMVFEFHDRLPKGYWNNIKHVFEESDMKAIEGEVYGVPLRVLANMDLEEQNGEGVERVERWVSLKHPMNEDKNIRCFMYVCDVDFFVEYFSYANDYRLCNSVGYTSVAGRHFDAYYAPENWRP